MTHHIPLLELVEGFLARTNMGEAYFGKKAVGNSELVARLRKGSSVLVTTDQKVRAFIMENHPPVKSGSGSLACQDKVGNSLPGCKGVSP